MDQGSTKKIEESARTFWKWNDKVDNEIKDLMPTSVTDTMKDDKLNEIKAKLNVSENLGNYYGTAEYISSAMGYSSGEKIEKVIALSYKRKNKCTVTSRETLLFVAIYASI